MGFELSNLLERDHRDLQAGLAELARAPSRAAAVETWTALRLAHAAHAGAELRVLASVLREHATHDRLQFLVAQLASAHRAQEQALASLLHEPDEIVARAAELHAVTSQHDAHERTCVLPVLDACMPARAYRELAARYATERLCLLTLAPAARRSDRRYR